MTVLKTDVSFSNRLNLYNRKLKSDAPISWPKVESILAERTKKLPPSGVKAIRAAFDEAKTKAGRNPTMGEINALLKRGRSSVENESAKGRVNDGYVDKRERDQLKSPVARAVFDYVNTVSPAKDIRTATGSQATFAQLDRAYKNLSAAVDVAFAKFEKIPDGDYGQLMGAIKSAANAANLPASGRSTLIIATNGKVGRGDNGSLESQPTRSEVKAALSNALAKLKGADGAKIVDFKDPTKTPTSRHDKKTSMLEVARTPSVTGQAALSLLEYASAL